MSIDSLLKLEVTTVGCKSIEMRFIDELAATEAAIEKRSAEIKFFVPSVAVLGLGEKPMLPTAQVASATRLASTGAVKSRRGDMLDGREDSDFDGEQDRDGYDDDDDDNGMNMDLFGVDDSDTSDRLEELDDSFLSSAGGDAGTTNGSPN